MKKLILSILVLSLSVFTLYSQETNIKPEREVRKFEMEFALGSSIGPFPSSNAGSRIHELSAIIFEMRWNLRNKPIDIGTQWYWGGQAYEHPTADAGGIDFFEINIILPTVFVDYNYKRTSNFSVFAGVGVGALYHTPSGGSYSINTWNPEKYPGEQLEDNFHSWFAVIPRCGVELFHHVRLTTFLYVTTEKEFIHLGATLGLVLGGGRKKKRNSHEYLIDYFK